MKLNKFRMILIECLEENPIGDVQDVINDTITDFAMGRAYKYDNDGDYDDFERMRNTKKEWK